MKRVLGSWTPLMLAVVVSVPAFGPAAFAADAAQQAVGTGNAKSAAKTIDDRDFQKLPKPGEKVALGPDYYFMYGFAKQPKLGAVIMKVQIFTQAGQPDSSFVVKGDLDMPSMRGAHSTGEKEFSLSKSGAFLLPANLVMPGDWEFRFTFEKNGALVFRGAYLFDI